MFPHVTLHGSRDLADQIYRQLRAAILDARLRAGQRLPATRELARDLGVARNTVSVAYERLAAEGYVRAQTGKGTVVRPGIALTPRRSADSPLRPKAKWDMPLWPPRLSTPRFDLRVGLPDARLFPYPQWRRLVSDELRATASVARGYGSAAGLPELREALARHIGLARGVIAAPSDVVVTNGIQQALDLVCRVFVEPGDVVAVEKPGYPPAAMVFASHDARVVGVPVDAEGIRVDALPGNARVVYTTPSHQFPLGTAMSLSRRVELLNWAAARDVVIIEDDYDSEFRFTDRPVETLHSLDRDGRVIYTGSFSKSMLPALRVGFLVAASQLRQALGAAAFVAGWGTDATTQGALARFIDDGAFARHIAKMLRVYDERQRLLRQNLTPQLRVLPGATGLHVTAVPIAEDWPLATVLSRMRSRGVACYSIGEAAADPRALPGLVLGYGAIDGGDMIPALLSAGLHRTPTAHAK